MRTFIRKSFYFRIIVLTTAILLITPGEIIAQDGEVEVEENDQARYYSQISLLQCRTATMKELERLTVELENNIDDISILMKLSDHFMIALLTDEMAKEIGVKFSKVEKIYRQPMTDAEKAGNPCKDKYDKFAISYWQNIQDQKLDFLERKVPPQPKNPQPELDDDIPGTDTDEGVQRLRAQALAEHPPLPETDSNKVIEERTAVLNVMNKFWDFVTNGKVDDIVDLFSPKIEAEERAKLKRSLERSWNEMRKDNNKRL